MQSSDNIFSRLWLYEEVGRGSFGCVYKTLDTSNNELYALKEIKITNKQELNSVKNELNIIKRSIKHVNLMSYYEFIIKDRKMDSIAIINRSNNRITRKNLNSNTNHICSTNSNKNTDFKNTNLVGLNTINNTNPGVLEDELQINLKSNKTHYCYIIIEWAELTLYDYVDLRNDIYYNIQTEQCTCQLLTLNYSSNPDLISSYPFHCKITHFSTGKKIPADLIVHSFIDTKKLNTQFIYFLLKNILIGLIHLQKNNLCHGDLKLNNIFLSKKYLPKLGDFGCVCLASISNKKKDLFKIAILWIELIVPTKTKHEMVRIKEKVIGEKIVPRQVLLEYPKDALIIEECLLGKTTLNRVYRQILQRIAAAQEKQLHK